MELADIISFVALMSIISIAVERSNEIIINGFDLDNKIKSDRARYFVYHLMAAVTGTLIYFFNADYHYTFLTRYFDGHSASIVAGLLASGGSGMWHEILKFVSNMSSSKKIVL